MTKQQVQRRYGRHQEYYPAYLISRHQCPDNSKYIIIIFFDQSNLIFKSYKVQNKSTKSSKHQAASKACHWILPLMSAFHITILLIVIDCTHVNIWLFLKCLHNKKHKLHEIMHLGCHQKIHQSLYIVVHIMLPWGHLFYLMNSVNLNKILHNMKILYQLLPIYRP